MDIKGIIFNMSIVASTFFLVFLKLAILFDKIFLEDNLH